ncbi:hypothetical protein [Sandaracinus amylolyticus]|uniref:hypothetical protein n=1 Tax=Sandaracinus amylolyticus TaxID=927083 RepID=UPI001F158CFA|nr:hypothetical protein [Sandaracinus amylolyticus]UJR81554.1 Hypothetical protein I5071_36140 [Sandaracinus amylolyticus]
MSEPAILGKIRETLEATLPSRDAARVLLDALAEWGQRVPSEIEEIESFVAVPLRDALRARLGDAHAKRVMIALEDVLATASAPTEEHTIPVDLSEIPDVWVEEETHDLPVLDAPVPVLVLAGRGGLAMRLAAALGPERIHARAAASGAAIDRALATPPVVVITDASDVPAVAAEELFWRLSRLPSSVTAVVWGSDLVYGARLAELASHSGRAIACLRVVDGFDPVLDLVLARRAGAPRDDA